jgi:hypothetical protein
MCATSAVRVSVGGSLKRLMRLQHAIGPRRIVGTSGTGRLLNRPSKACCMRSKATHIDQRKSP